MHRIEAKTITEAYPEILELVMLEGKVSSPRGMKTYEVEDVTIKIEDVTQPFVLQKERKLNYPYCILEPILLTRPQTFAAKEAACFYVGKFLNSNVVNPTTGLMDGWYGDRINQRGINQLLKVYTVLLSDPDSRRAILTIHNSNDELQRMNSLDIPCTLDLQFLIRDNKLDCIVNMRGNDALLGTPQNFAMWTFMQRLLAAWLCIPPGNYYHRVGVLHLYDRDMKRAVNIRNDSRNYITNKAIVNQDWTWKISSPISSLQQCEKFAEAEKFYRDFGDINLLNQYMMKINLHPSLQPIIKDIFVPYIDKKNAKKKSGNPYALIDQE